MNNLPSHQSILLQGLGMIIVLPILVIVLGELAERCKRHKNPLAKVFNTTRNLLLPPLAIWLIMDRFFYVPKESIALRVIGSLFGIAFIYTFLLLLNTLLAIDKKQQLWQVHIPNLLFQLLRVIVMVSVLGYVLSEVWGIDLTKVVGALGIGSLVMALALQDTLSNLVSGFLLIVESPFKVGDWIKIGDLQGEVIEINWRAVRLKTIDRDIIIIPNGKLGKENICNFTLLDPLHAIRLKIPFSHEDHPDLVEQLLLAVALSVDGIQSHPLPTIAPQVYRNTHIEYEICFFIKHYSEFEIITHKFWTSAYYAIRRNRLHVPFADKMEIKLERPPINPNSTPERLAEILRSLPLFARLDQTTIQYLTQHTTVELYGIKELIVAAGVFDKAFYVLLSGQVLLSVDDQAGQKQEIDYLSEGDFLGEMVFLPIEPSLVSATVTQTVTLISIAPTAIVYLIQHHPKFAIEMSQFIDERKKLIHKNSIDTRETQR
jgi:small-conductance mechanosensitive channel